MTWFKVDDQFATHPKALKAGNAACGLWVRAGSWSAAQLTDGVIPAEMVAVLGGRATDTDRLISARLWHRAGHDCPECEQPDATSFIFHGWEDHQPTRARVKARREEDAQRKAEARAAKRRSGLKVAGNV